MAKEKAVRTFEEKFQEEYAKLNAGQKKAVDAIEGPVMVVAGPGTGKTTTLTLRIANILQHGVPASTILALTFTESAAANMRRKLVELVGSDGYYVNINTFHGFCNSLIQNYPQYFERVIGAENVTAAGFRSSVSEWVPGRAFMPSVAVRVTTDARYQPPPPYVPRADPYEPFALAAVELDAEGIVVLGQVADGYGVDDLSVGAPVELVVEPLYTDGDGIERTVWRWKPVAAAGEDRQ